MLVVDDASTDDSVERVVAIGQPDVIGERFTINLGAGIGRNHCFERATGRYTLFFDADDEIHPMALTAAIEALDDTGAELAMMPYRYRRGHSSSFDGMNSFDYRKHCLNIIASRRRRPTWHAGFRERSPVDNHGRC